MSVLEYNLVSAGGDGLKRKDEKTPLRRTPIPSSRKLTARPQVKNDNVKVKLEKAIHQLSSPKIRQFSRKRAQTMAEITPSKRKHSIELRLSGEGDAIKSAPRKEDASRRVYQQLLLNAWRRRRTQVATLTDSSRRLQTQVDQLQIQVDVLQKLRESESCKRLESANETERLRCEKDELTDRIEDLVKDGETMETSLFNLQQRLEEINVNYVNLKNELVATKTELCAYETKLRREYRNKELLEAEKQDLLQTINEYKNTSIHQIEIINRLEKDLESVESNLEEINLNNSGLEESKSELAIKLEKEKDIRDDLEQQFIKSRLREEKLERRVHELKKSVNILNETKKRMLLDNFALKNALEELEDTLKEERTKTWWKNAAKVMLNTLHNAAYVMLPAYPKEIDLYAPIVIAAEEKKSSLY